MERLKRIVLIIWGPILVAGAIEGVYLLFPTRFKKWVSGKMNSARRGLSSSARRLMKNGANYVQPRGFR